MGAKVTSTGRRWRLRTVVTVLAAGMIALTGVALPSAAQEPTSTTTSTTTSTSGEPPGATTVATPPGTVATPPGEATAPSTPTTDGTGPGPDGTGPGGTIPTTPAPPTAGPPASPQPAGPPVTAAAAAMTLTPAADLVDGTAVSVAATGLPAGLWVQLVQCPSGAESSWFECDTDDDTYAEVDQAGAATFDIRVDALLTSSSMGDPDGEPREIDCRVAGACVLAVADD